MLSFSLIYAALLLTQPAVAPPVAAEGRWRLRENRVNSIRECTHDDFPTMILTEARTTNEPGRFSESYPARLRYDFPARAATRDKVTINQTVLPQGVIVNGPIVHSTLKGESLRGISSIAIMIDGVDVGIPLNDVTIASDGNRIFAVSFEKTQERAVLLRLQQASALTVRYLDKKGGIVHEATFNVDQYGGSIDVLGSAQLRCPEAAAGDGGK